MNKLRTVRVVQMNLFLPRPTLPAWTQLPLEVQQETRELLAQLLSEYLTAEASESFGEGELP